MDWDIDEERSTPITHVLAPGERKYMLKGDTGNLSRYQVENMKDRIREKEAQLPARFQDLVDDLTLFHRFGILETNNWADSSESRTRKSYDSKAAKTCKITPRISDFKDLSRPIVEPLLPARFGFELGCALRLIFEASDETEDYRRVLWGFLLSDVVNHSTDFQEQTRYLEDLLSEFRELNDERVTHQKEAEKEVGAFLRTTEDNLRTIEPIAREVWLEAGLEPADEKTSIFIEATYPSGPPMESPEKYKRELKEVLERNLPELEFVSRLESDIITDAQFALDRNPSGVSTENLLLILLKSFYVEKMRGKGSLERLESPTESHPIFDEDDALDSLEIPLSINEIKEVSNTSQQQVTRALRQLKDKHLNSQWPQHKVVEGSKESAEWQLTDYGLVLAMYLFITGKETEWMYEAIFNNLRVDSERRRKRTVLDGALNEIRGEPNEPNKYYVSRRFDVDDFVKVNIPGGSDQDKAKYHGEIGVVEDVLTDDLDSLTDEWVARLYRVHLKSKRETDYFTPRELTIPEYE